MRATRDLLRRRMPLMRTRAALRTHSQTTNSQDNLPASGKNIADKAHRTGGAERFPEPAAQKRMEVALALLEHDAHLRSDLER
jgi:hypothetical protein